MATPVTLQDLERIGIQIDVAEGWTNPNEDDWYDESTDPDLAHERWLETRYWMDAEEERAREGHLWPWTKDDY
jgi:hypothetical protein